MRPRSLVLAASLVSLPACAGAPPRPAETAAAQATPETGAAAARDVRPTRLVATSGRVSLSAFALAGRVTWQSMRTVGRAAAGLFASGAGAAERGWRAGAKDTRDVARHEAEAVRQSARSTE